MPEPHDERAPEDYRDAAEDALARECWWALRLCGRDEPRDRAAQSKGTGKSDSGETGESLTHRRR